MRVSYRCRTLACLRGSLLILVCVFAPTPEQVEKQIMLREYGE